MNDIYNEIKSVETAPKKEPAPKKEYNKESWAKAKKDEKDGAYQMIEDTVNTISKDGNKLKEYLSLQGKLDKYSMCNTVLIMAQKPNATQLKDFNTWKEAGATIKNGEKGIVILEPAGEYHREDGSTSVSFKTKKIFDVVQTTSKEKNKPQVNLDEKFVLKALIKNAIVPIKAVDELEHPNMGAFYDPNQKIILVRKSLDNNEFFVCVSQELAHATFAKKGNYSRNANGLKAMCVSYALCSRYSIDTSYFKLNELPVDFRKQNQKEMRNTLEEIRSAMTDINDRMSKSFEQNRTPKQKDKSQER